MRAARIAAAAGVALLGATAAGSSVPPPPPDDTGFVAASCSSTQMGVPDPVAATVTPLTATPLVPKSASPLTMQWGVRVSTTDPRVGDLTALALSGPYGLLATTARGNWLTFDLQGGSLAGLKTVGVAPIRGAAGRPTSMADLYGSLSFVAFADSKGTIARLALSTCGTDAVALPWLTTEGTTAPVIVQGSYTYLGIVAPDPVHGDALLLPYTPKPAAVPVAPNPFVHAGQHLVALSNPARIVPYILALTAQDDHPGATLRLVYRERWGDVWGGRTIAPRTVLQLTRTPSAMASFRGKDGTTTVLLAFPTDRPGTIDLYRFDGNL